jgi:hypothetical protein
MAEKEIDPLDRVYDLVLETLDSGQATPTELLGVVKEAVDDWRLDRAVARDD